jgi:hypothetical protein
MPAINRLRRWLSAGIVLCSLGWVAAPAAALTPPLKCEKVAAKALRRCVKTVNRTLAACYDASGATCPGSEPKLVKALDKLSIKVPAGCPDAATVAAAGYGPSMTPATLVARLQEACRGDAASLAARAFGGPHARALADADPTERACLVTTQKAGAKLVERTLKEQANCALKVHRGKSCDTAQVTSRVTALQADAIADITDDCAATLAGLIGIDASTYALRLSRQTGCLTAAALGDSSPLDLGCGPRPAITIPARGADTQVILDEASYGTRCGDGSPYALRIRLAPTGEPVEKVMIHLQGGGACLSEADCQTVSPALFAATDNLMPGGGLFATDLANNPTFATWTHVHLPYCTQDLHMGGGAVSNFPAITVNRFGALNVRGALNYVRDVVWSELDANTSTGYRPDLLQVVFSGTSAGAFGVQYNYHYLLDDLRWARTTAVPDAGLGLDNGGVGIGLLGAVALSNIPPGGWDAQPFLPPYCFGIECPVVPAMAAAHAARLLAAPEQQILQVSNQNDAVQVSTTLFPNLVSWINALRTSYCALQGSPGLHYFLSANTASIHGTVTNNGQFTGLTAAGVVLGDWLADAVANPAAVTDAVSEGTFVATFGADPFSCTVAP